MNIRGLGILHIIKQDGDQYPAVSLWCEIGPNAGRIIIGCCAGRLPPQPAGRPTRESPPRLGSEYESRSRPSPRRTRPPPKQRRVTRGQSNSRPERNRQQQRNNPALARTHRDLRPARARQLQCVRGRREVVAAITPTIVRSTDYDSAEMAAVWVGTESRMQASR